MHLKKNNIVLISAILSALAVNYASAGALDGGTTMMVTDVAVTGAISSVDGFNTTVGNGSTINGSVLSGGGNNSVFGASASTSGNHNTVIGAGASTGLNAVNSVVLGAGSVATVANSVSFGDSALGITRVLQNVTSGTQNNDAANVGQMNSAITAAINALPPATDNVARVSAATAQTTADAATVTATNADTKATTALTTANTANTNATTALNQVGGFNTRIGSLENRMGGLENGVAASMAMSAANSNAVQAAYRSTKGMGLGIGASVFAGRSVTALSFAANLGFGSVSASASLSGKPGVQVGAGFAF